MGEETMQIGEVARRTGLTHRAVRYYEERGLLDTPTREDSGFRRYTDLDVQRIQYVLQLKNLLGCSLAEIKRTLGAATVLGDVSGTLHRERDAKAELKRLRDGIRVVTLEGTLIDRQLARLRAMQERWHARLARYREDCPELNHEAKHPQATADEGHGRPANAYVRLSAPGYYQRQVVGRALRS